MRMCVQGDLTHPPQLHLQYPRQLALAESVAAQSHAEPSPRACGQPPPVMLPVSAPSVRPAIGFSASSSAQVPWLSPTEFSLLSTAHAA